MLLRHYCYRIVGTGVTADAAPHGSRAVDPDGSIGLVGDEPVPLYYRPHLSKMLWIGEPLHQTWRKPERVGVELHLGRRIGHLDPSEKPAIDIQGEVYSFDRCLRATGGTPRCLSFGDDHIIYHRALTDVYERFAVIGGGFVGSEIAASHTMNNEHFAVGITRPHAVPSTGRMC